MLHSRVTDFQKVGAGIPSQRHAVSSPQAGRASRMKRTTLLGWRPTSLTTYYASAVLSIVVALIAAELLARVLNAEAIATTLLCAVIFAAWVGGLRPALLAIALGLLAFHYSLASPNNSFVWKHGLS